MEIPMRSLSSVLFLSALLAIPAEAAPRPVAPAGVPVVVAGTKLIAAGRAISQVMSELNRYRSVIWHDWYCQYADGTLVHNDFRWYRSSTDVWNYFVGRPNKHDCDATVTDAQKRRLGKFNTRNAEAFALAHGGIVFVGRE